MPTKSKISNYLIERYDLLKKEHVFIRALEIDWVPKKANSVLGVRRSGKSAFCQNLLKEHDLKGGASIWLDFSDGRLHQNEDAERDFQSYLDSYFETVGAGRLNAPVLLCLDEPQLVSGWERFVDPMLKRPECKVLITGSTAELSGREITSQLRGRTLDYEFFPLSFSEYLTFKNKSDLKNGLRTSEANTQLKNLFRSYCREGGFPEVVLTNEKNRFKILQSYFESILNADILERLQSNQFALGRRFFQLLIQQMSQSFTLNKMHEKLKSQQFKFDRHFLSDLLNQSIETYFIYPVTVFSESIQKQNVNPKKCYLVDHSFHELSTFDPDRNIGRTLENIVFMQLRRSSSDISYYKTSSGFEVDFVVREKNRLKLFQVCASLDDEETKNRELRAMVEASRELSVDELFLLTFDEEKLLEIDSKKIEVIPIWKWLLSTE